MGENMNLSEAIMLQRKDVVADSMGGQGGKFADLQLARAVITPLRDKSGLIEGGKKAVGVYKIVTWRNAFADAHVGGVKQGDRFIWVTNGDRELYLNVEHFKPIGDVYAEYEVTLTEG